MVAAGQQREMLWIDATADGWVVPLGANALYGDSKQAAVPSIIGNNVREIAFELEPAQTIGLIQGLYGKHAETALKLYGIRNGSIPPDDPVLGSVSAQLLTDTAFRCPAERTVALQKAQGQKVWRYEFGVPEPGATTVAHNAELKYLFGERPAGASPTKWPPVQEYWANFVKTGDPDGPGLPQWPEVGKDGAFMAFTPDGPQPGAGEGRLVCRLLIDASK
jgi:para-nitrobenzyl esterase